MHVSTEKQREGWNKDSNISKMLEVLEANKKRPTERELQAMLSQPTIKEVSIVSE